MYITVKQVREAWDYSKKMQKKKQDLKGKTGYFLWRALARKAVKMYRDTLHEYFNQFEYPFDRVFNDKGDSFTAYIVLPSHVNTIEKAKQYYIDCLEERCTPSQYDCTGERFNYLLGVQKRSDGHYGVYVRYCYDV